MASSLPENTPPLHNFSLPTWSNHHRGRRNRTSSPPPFRRRNSYEIESENRRRSPANQTVQPRSSADQTGQKRRPLESSASRSSPLRRPESASEPESDNRRKSQADRKGDQTVQKRPSTSASEGGGAKKICIKIRNVQIRKPSPERVREEIKAPQKEEERVEERDEMEETLAKTWNFRPRKQSHNKSSNKNGGRNDLPDKNKSQSQAHKANVDSKEEKKLKFSISLTKAEIEEDIYAMTGSKPSRKPKKRSKTVQKQLDNLFPGLWLSSVTPDLYKVDEAPPKA